MNLLLLRYLLILNSGTITIYPRRQEMATKRMRKTPFPGNEDLAQLIRLALGQTDREVFAAYVCDEHNTCLGDGRTANLNEPIESIVIDRRRRSALKKILVYATVEYSDFTVEVMASIGLPNQQVQWIQYHVDVPDMAYIHPHSQYGESPEKMHFEKTPAVA